MASQANPEQNRSSWGSWIRLQYAATTKVKVENTKDATIAPSPKPQGEKLRRRPIANAVARLNTKLSDPRMMWLGPSLPGKMAAVRA